MRRCSLRHLVLVPALLAAHAARADEGGFVPLFDGKTTAGWTTVGGKPENWPSATACS